jgi:hypothetical protein
LNPRFSIRSQVASQRNAAQACPIPCGCDSELPLSQAPCLMLVAKAEDLLAQVCRVERKNSRRARKRFSATLAALDDAFAADA